MKKGRLACLVIKAKVQAPNNHNNVKLTDFDWVKICGILNEGLIRQKYCTCIRNIQGDQKVSVHLMITVEKHAKIFLNGLSHLPR
jgi:hypothetical protein